MSSVIEPKILKGFRDFLPVTEIERQRIQHILADIFEGHGFVPIDTPALEYTEVLLGKGGGETDKQMYRFRDNGKRDVAMRFDLTVPFARYVAKHRQELYLPFRRYHMAKVWRGENTQKGRYREFTQCDFDIVGTDSWEADFEIISLIASSMEALNTGGYTIRLSHRGIFNRMLTRLGLEDRNVFILRTVDKLSKIGREKVTELLTEQIAEEEAETILSFIAASGDFITTLSAMEELAGGESDDSRRLKDIWETVKVCGLEESIILDPSITRGLDYYTGLVYETFLKELPGIGSVCSGGRYNNLASLYSKEQMPGVGASVGLDRLLAGLEELGRIRNKASNTDLIILNMDKSLGAYYQKLARDLRREGIKTEVYPDQKKLGPQFSYAEKKDIPLAVLCGSDEMTAGELTIKVLEKRENITISAAGAAAKIKELIKL